MKKFIVLATLLSCLAASPAMAKVSSSAGSMYYIGLMEDQAEERAAQEIATKSTSPFGNFTMPTFDSSSLSSFWSLLGF